MNYERERLFAVGQQMSNLCFNLSQNAGKPISEGWAATMGSLASQWDEAKTEAPFRVGDLVEAIAPYRLACGSGIYDQAVVVNIDPLVLVSQQGDMLWRATVTTENVKKIGTANPTNWWKAFRRWADELHQKFNSDD